MDPRTATHIADRVDPPGHTTLPVILSLIALALWGAWSVIYLALFAQTLMAH